MNQLPAPVNNCPTCPVTGISPATASAIVRLSADGESWTFQPVVTLVHLVALFRDPATRDGRPVPTVLDLSAGPEGTLTAGRSCWVRSFLEALHDLPVGITVALDNGVRCPCTIRLGTDEYRKRARACHAMTAAWHRSLKHPDGKAPGIAICDKDLACSLAQLGLLTRRDGARWHCPARFLDAVGDEVTYLGVDGLIAAHPVVLQRQNDYRRVFHERGIAERVRALARFDPD